MLPISQGELSSVLHHPTKDSTSPEPEPVWGQVIYSLDLGAEETSYKVSDHEHFVIAVQGTRGRLRVTDRRPREGHE